MTDARVSREHVEALIAASPSARVSREHIEALIAASPDGRVSRAHVEALIQTSPDARLSREHIEVLYKDTGPQVAGAGRAIGTETALPMTVIGPQYRTVGMATETETANEIRPVGVVILGAVPVETDTAQPMTVIGPRYFPVGLASTETDTAQPFTPILSQVRTVGQAEESDTADKLTPAFPMRRADDETDSADQITALPGPVTVTVGMAVETDDAQVVTPHTALGIARETDIARPINIEWVSNPSGIRKEFGPDPFNAAYGYTVGYLPTPGVPFSGSYLSYTDTPPPGGPASTAVVFNGPGIPGVLTEGTYLASPDNGEFPYVGGSRRITVEAWVYLDAVPGDGEGHLLFWTYADDQLSATSNAFFDAVPGQWVHFIKSIVTPSNKPKVSFTYKAGNSSSPTTLYMAGMSIRTEPTNTLTLDQPIETETARTITPIRLAVHIPVAQTSETDTAQPIKPVQAGTVHAALETDVGQAITPAPGAVTVQVGTAVEEDTATVIPTTPADVVPMGLATEDEVAFTITPLTGSLTRQLLQAIEIDTADALTYSDTPAIVGTLRWVLEDLVTHAIYTFPINPDSMTPILRRREITHARFRYGVTSQETVQRERSLDWSGAIRTQAHYDALREWAAKRNAIRLTDHVGRSFRIYITEFVPVDRSPIPSAPTRWRYTIKSKLLEEL